MSPLAFFAGRTEGTGVMKVLLSKSRVVHVHGTGHALPDGSLTLDQTVEEDGRPTTTRRWHVEAVGADHYSGTLTDAIGPVTGETAGNQLHLRFKTKGGMVADQWLSLRPGGTTADNVMVVRKFGVAVATLRETIRRAGA